MGSDRRVKSGAVVQVVAWREYSSKGRKKEKLKKTGIVVVEVKLKPVVKYLSVVLQFPINLSGSDHCRSKMPTDEGFQLSGVIYILILALHFTLLQTEVRLEVRRLVPIGGRLGIPQPHIYWDPQTMLKNYSDRVRQGEVYTEFLSRRIVET